VAPCQVQEEPEKDRITKKDGGVTEHIFVLVVVDYATRAFVVMAAVGGGGGAWTGEGAPAREEEERRRERRRSSAGGGEGGVSPLVGEHWRGRRRNIGR
jgi:hypothetical protein